MLAFRLRNLRFRNATTIATTMDASALIEQANARSELAYDVFYQFDADQSGYLGFRELRCERSSRRRA